MAYTKSRMESDTGGTYLARVPLTHPEMPYSVRQVLGLNPGPCTLYHSPISLMLGLIDLQSLLTYPCSPQTHNPPVSPTRGLWLSSTYHHHVWLSKFPSQRQSKCLNSELLISQQALPFSSFASHPLNHVCLRG